MLFSQMMYGGDYYPEQWDEQTWQQDVRLMEQAGVNLVTLGVFAWQKLEPQPGQYDFDWLKRVLDLMHAHHIGVCMATPTASPPAWLVTQHPEILPVTDEGVTLWHGSRRHYCPNSSAYRRAAANIVERLAQHAGHHPALKIWHIDNEYGCHVSECFCDASAAAFREWLQQRYGSLEELNRAWGSLFWGQAYSGWEEVIPPRRMPAQCNPARLLDWQRFCSDAWLACFEEQADILRRLTPEIPLTTNFMGFHRPLDYWKWAARQDLVANDCYPDTSAQDWMLESGMACDLMRSLGGGKPWLLMEQAPSHVNWRARNPTKRPGVMRRGSYQAVARGANGVMFFQWRASLAGSEKFHSAVVPHAGPDSRVFREVSELGSELPLLQELLPGRVKVDAAILFDWDSWHALEQDEKPDNEIRLLPHIKTLYGEFFRRNITLDFAHPEADLSQYRLVLAPHLYLAGEKAAANLRSFVQQGGTLLMTYLSGLVDENDRVLPGGYPALFRDVLGLWVEEFSAYAAEQRNCIRTAEGQVFDCNLWSDIIRLEGAKSLADYTQDYFSGSPALTRNEYGSGAAYYLGTGLKGEGLSWLVGLLCRSAALQPVLDVTPGVECVRRSDGENDWLFLINHTEDEIQVQLGFEGAELLSGQALERVLSLAGGAVAIVRRRI